MQVEGVISTLSSRLDGAFRTAATPPTTNQLVDSINTRPSAEFQGNFSASKFTPEFSPDPSKQLDIQV
jgi:hypothetical protein